ncbi:KIF-binding protein-like [Diadema setosum]|uniref:KIF-binding protein-like n=1 Tax=Diadema setosum TaxID=31175 RepID=UPI003B3B6EB3
MAASRDVQNIVEKYAEARKLSEQDSKNDPETDPYRSKYKAREVLHDIRKELESSADGTETSKEVKFRLAVVQYQLGVNFLETEETSSGHEHLVKANDILKEYRMDERCIQLALNILNQLAILWCTRRDHEKAKEFLLEAESLFKSFKKEVGSSPYILHELFLDESNMPSDHEREREFEKCYTLTLYYLAQVYEKQGEKTLAARYCHTTLKRQLETDQYDPVDWALNCATLSQYYITQDDYQQARHCLASATRIFSEAENKPIQESEMDRDDIEAWEENIKSRKADIARCWVKYCISLLQYSKEQELRGRPDNASSAPGAGDRNVEECSADQDPPGDDAESEEDKLAQRFESLELTSLEGQVGTEVVKTFDEARSLFLPAQRWINSAKEYYVLDGHVSDHIEIVRDHSQLFKLIAFFELDFERRCKMHKRRIDMLTDMLDGLNRQHFLLICRQLMYELAETYSEMMDLKIAILEQATPTVKAATKINSLCSNSLKFYKEFIDSTRNIEGNLPEKFEDDVLRPVLVAYFCMGRLYSKFITPHTQQRLDNLQQSLNHYKAVVDYCSKHPDCVERVKEEVDLCKEMVELIPLRILNIRGEVQL